MLLSSLSAQLVTRELVDPVLGNAWAWRIQHDYPAALREAAEAWAENRPLPEVQMADQTLSSVMAATGASAPQALELLYVFSRSTADGFDLLARCTRRDRLR